MISFEEETKREGSLENAFKRTIKMGFEILWKIICD
jgi:hypothetical protein